MNGILLLEPECCTLLVDSVNEA